MDGRRTLAKTLNLSRWLTGCRLSMVPDFQRRGQPAPPTRDRKKGGRQRKHRHCARQNREKTCFLPGRPADRTGGADSRLSFCPVTGCLRPVGFAGRLALKVQLARQNQEKTWFCWRAGNLSLRAVGAAVAVVETKPGKDLVSSWTAAGSGSPPHPTRNGQPPDRACGLDHQKPGKCLGGDATKKHKTG